MAYQILYTKSAFKDIQKLDSVVKKKIKNKIEIYSKNPLFYGKKLLSPKLGSYRWRAGNYRVVFDIDREKIVILRIGHRKEIYK